MNLNYDVLNPAIIQEVAHNQGWALVGCFCFNDKEAFVLCERVAPMAVAGREWVVWHAYMVEYNEDPVDVCFEHGDYHFNRDKAVARFFERSEGVR